MTSRRMATQPPGLGTQCSQRPFATGITGPESWSPRPLFGFLSAPGALPVPTVGGGGQPSTGRRPDEGADSGNPSPKKKSKKKRYEGEDQSVKQDGVFVKNRRGAKICADFNKGKCGSKKPQSKCKDSCSHQCNLCLGPHSAVDCTRS